MQRLQVMKERLAELNELMSRPEVASDSEQMQRYAQEYGELSRMVAKMEQYSKVLQCIEDDRALLSDSTLDPELRQLAKEELEHALEKKLALEKEIRRLLIPADPLDQKNVIMEIRAATGGDEAALFAADLFRMYTHYAERKGWRTEIMSSHPTERGGFKEIIFLIQGSEVHSRFKYEAGTHRVQRVPETEAAGRIHTSTVTVAVLPEAEEVDVEIDPEDLRIDVFRSAGPGGQSVNTTDSAVRITHIPTGLVVSCQDEKSQHKNRAKALKVLRARLLAMRQEEEHRKRSQERRRQVGMGERSERIRTYNFPQSRITEHRVNLTLYKLGEVLEGELDPIIEALQDADEQGALETSALQALL